MSLQWPIDLLLDMVRIVLLSDAVVLTSTLRRLFKGVSSCLELGSRELVGAWASGWISGSVMDVSIGSEDFICWLTTFEKGLPAAGEFEEATSCILSRSQRLTRTAIQAIILH